MTLFQQKNDKRCPCCQAEWNSNALKASGLKGCPHCRTVLEPLKVIEDGYVHLNWQDLRVLVLYAKRWSKIFDTNNRTSLDAIQALNNIIAKVQVHRPETGALLIPEQDIVTIEKAIKESSQGMVVELTIKHASEDTVEVKKSIPSPYFANIT